MNKYTERQKLCLIARFIGQIATQKQGKITDKDDSNYKQQDKEIIEVLSRIVGLSLEFSFDLSTIDSIVIDPNRSEVNEIATRQKITKTELESKKPHIQQGIKDTIIKDLAKTRLKNKLANSNPLIFGDSKIDQNNLDNISEIEIETALKLARAINKMLP